MTNKETRLAKRVQMDKDAREERERCAKMRDGLKTRVDALRRKAVAAALDMSYDNLSQLLLGYKPIKQRHVDAIEAACRSLENCGVENHSPKGQ